MKPSKDWMMAYNDLMVVHYEMGTPFKEAQKDVYKRLDRLFPEQAEADYQEKHT